MLGKTTTRDNVASFLFAPTGQPTPKNGYRKRRVYSRARGSRKLGRVQKGRKGTFASEYHAVLNVRHGWNSFDTPAATSASPATRHRSPRMCRYNPRSYALHTRDPHVQTSEWTYGVAKGLVSLGPRVFWLASAARPLDPASFYRSKGMTVHAQGVCRDPRGDRWTSGEERVQDSSTEASLSRKFQLSVECNVYKVWMFLYDAREKGEDL